MWKMDEAIKQSKKYTDSKSPYTLLDYFINSGEIEIAQIAGIKNSMFRGKNLGTSYTSEQQSQVASGKFLDLWVGDYWEVNGTRYYISAFNYYLDTGDLNLTTNHITLITGGSMYTHRMNPTNTTEGGYIGSEMYEEGLDQAKSTIHDAFPGSVITHRRWLSNATSDGAASGAGWFDSDVELMNEHMVYGSNAVANSVGQPDAHRCNVGIEKSQLPLFRLRHDLIGIRTLWWLRDIVSASLFAYVSTDGVASRSNAPSAVGVRPVFSISA